MLPPWFHPLLSATLQLRLSSVREIFDVVVATCFAVLLVGRRFFVIYAGKF
jgi:hypothetical protein